MAGRFSFFLRQGRVGTGLAYLRDTWTSDAAANRGWFDQPKPCSLTALASLVPERSAKKTVVDLILFVCQPFSRHDTVSNKENNGMQWWDNLSDPGGLLVTERQTLVADEDGDKDEDEIGDEHAVEDDKPSQHEKQSSWTAVNLATLPKTHTFDEADDTAYPLALAHETKDAVPRLYYYAWKKERLLQEDISLERVLLTDMIVSTEMDRPNGVKERIEGIIRPFAIAEKQDPPEEEEWVHLPSMEQAASDGAGVSMLHLGKEDPDDVATHGKLNTDATDEFTGIAAPDGDGAGSANINQQATEVDTQSSECERDPPESDASPDTTAVNTKEEEVAQEAEENPLANPAGKSEDVETQTPIPQDSEDIADDPVQTTTATTDIP